MPSEPVSMAATSDSTSPNRLSVTITSYCLGQRTSCMAQLSASTCSSVHLGVFGRVDAGDHLVPQYARLHHVALFGRGDLVAAGRGQLEGDAGDALDLVGVVDLRVDAALLAVAEVGDGLGFAEVDAARQFTDDQDVEPFHHLALERGGIGQRRIADGRTQVGEEAEILAQPQQARLGAHIVRHLVPLGPAHRAEEHGVGGHGHAPCRHSEMALPWAS